MKFSSLARLFGKRKASSKHRSPSRSQARKMAPLAVEHLEDRTVMSVLPAPVATNQIDILSAVNKAFAGSFAGNHNTPSVIVDPLNANNLVAVFQTDTAGSAVIQGIFSTNGGTSWSPFPTNISQPLADPTLAFGNNFTQYTTPTVTIDSKEQIYVSYSAHRLDNSAGAIVFQKYDFSSGFPTRVTPANPDKIHAAGVLYEWAAGSDAASDPALNPVIVADANLASYTDPETGATQADPLIDTSIDPNTGQPRNQGMVYVAWNTNYAAPAQPGDAINFTPNSIKLVASSDGGGHFTTQAYANTDGELPNKSVFGEKAADPQLAISQGTSTTRSTPVAVTSITRTGSTATVTTSTPHGFLTGDQVAIAGATPPEYDGTFIITVTGPNTFTYTMPVNATTPNSASGTITATKIAIPGGQLNLVYSDFGRGQIRSDSVNDGGTGVVFTDTTGGHINDAVDPGNNAPHIPGVTLFKQDVSITDPNFTTASDLDVTVDLLHANLEQLRIRLLPEARIKSPFGMVFGPDGNLYVAGNASNTVSVYDGTTGTFLKVFADSSVGISAPDGLAFDYQGNLYVANSGTDQVLRFKPDGTPFPSGINPGAVFFAPGAGFVPTGLTFGPDVDALADPTPAGALPGQNGFPDLYVSDAGNNRVVVVDAEVGAPTDGTLAKILVANGVGGLSSPEGLTFGPDGNLYVASTGDNTVKRYNGTTGLSMPSAGNAGATYATQANLAPEGVAFGPDGNLYVSSDAPGFFGGKVVRFKGPIPTGPGTAPKEGQFLDNWVTAADGLRTPHGVVFKPNYVPQLQLDANQQDVLSLTSEFFVADAGNDEVLRFAPVPGVPEPGPSTPPPPAGLTDATLVSPTTNGPSTPHSMLLVPSGAFGNPFNLVVANTGSNKIQVYNATTGAFVSTFQNTANLQQPWGIAEQGGNVFVSSNGNDRILEYDATTQNFVTTFVVQGSGGLSQPTGLAFGPADQAEVPADPSPDTTPELYVSSFGNDSIMRYDGSTGTPLPVVAGNGAVFVSSGLGTLSKPTGLVFSPNNKTLFVSSSGNNKILEYDAQTGAFLGVLADATDSPLSSPGDLVFGSDGTLYVTSTGNNRVLRFNVNAASGTFLGTYMESMVPVNNNATNGGGLDGAYGLALSPNFGNSAIYVGSLNNNKIMRYFGTPAIADPSAGNAGAVFVFAGGGGAAITLLQNHLDSSGNSRGPVGIPSGANLGLVGPDNNNLHSVGTVFDQNAPRAISDGNFGGTAAAPFAAHFRPDSGSLGSGGLLDLVGPSATPGVLNGQWTLEVTDFRSNQSNGVDPVQFVANWSMQFTSRLTPNPERLVAGGAAAGNASEAGSTISVGGAAVGSLPSVTLASPNRGVGPTPSFAIDNTLGSFSPYQGRLYVAYTTGGGNATDIFLSTSDDGGNTWLKTPVKVNDDSAADNFSEGIRPQFTPTVAVDQATGTLVISFYDARNDAAQARVATYLATSLDGGWKIAFDPVTGAPTTVPDFAPETYLNKPQTAKDAITGKTVIIGPIPDNQSANGAGDTQFNYGDRAGLAVSSGHVYPLWTGNFNAAGSSILTATTTIAGGPRIVSSTMGPVPLETDPITGAPVAGLLVTDDKANPTTYTFNDKFAADGTQEVDGFVVTFDRPIDVSTFDPSNIQVIYHSPNTPAGTPGTLVNRNSYTITPLDGWTTRYGPAQVGGINPTTGKPILSTTFLVQFAPQSAVGTYSYAINATGSLQDANGNPIPIRDKIRTILAGVAPGTPLTPFTASPFANIPPGAPADTGGHGSPGATNAPGPNTSPDPAVVPREPAGYDLKDTTFSPITISGVTNGRKITNISVTINIQHTAESDLIIDLVAPNGTTVHLVNREGGNSGTTGFVGTTFTTNPADPPISTGSDPFPGTYQPETPLTQLIGQNVKNGDVWWLVVDDTTQGDTGRLLSWTLNLSTGASAVNQQLGNGMDQNANAVQAEPPTTTSAGDTYAVPTPLQGPPFQLPYDQNTLPLIVPGPHVVSTFVPGQPVTPDNLVLNNTVSFIDVTFDRDMDPSSFTAASIVRLMGPAGLISGPFTVTADPNPTPPPGSPAGTAYPRTINGATSTGADPDSAHPRTFRIGIPTRPNSLVQTPGQDLSGTYTLTLSPSIRSKAGDQLDTNENAGLDVLRGGSPGSQILVDSVQSRPGFAPSTTFFIGSQSLSAVDNFYKGKVLTFTSGVNAGLSRVIDGYIGSFREFTFVSDPWPAAPAVGDAFNIQLTTPVSATYSGPAVTLPPNKTTTIPLTFNQGSFQIQSATVQLDITYPHDPDLEAALVAPDGTTVQLFTNVGASGTRANFTNTILDDRGTTPIQQGVPPFNSSIQGNFNPQQPLALLNGKNSAGVWKLVIKNDATSVSGTHQLNSWSLTLGQFVLGTGLGESIADQATVHFRIFTQDPSDPVAHDTWTAVGPASINADAPGLNGANSGRIGGLAVDPSDPSGNTVYIGGASGGIWKTTNFLTTNPTGPTYIPLTDFGPTFAINIGSIAVFGRNNDPNQSIIFATTGEGDTGSQGVGILRSMDGGATWTLLDSTNNVDDPRVGFGNLTPFNAASRDHIFAKNGGTTSFKVVVDPTHAPSGPDDVIVYAALSSPAGGAGGLWRSLDSGRHWAKVSDDAQEGTDCTDVTLALNSTSPANNNVQVVFAAFRGKGVYLSQAQGAGLVLMTGGQGNTLIVDGSSSPAQSIPVKTPAGVTPNGAKGRIVLAAPALTGIPVQDLLYEGWLYAAVSNGSGLDGLYLTKDFGANWTLVHLPFTGVGPTNDETKPDANVLGNQGDYDISLAIDPSNPAIVYLGGTSDFQPVPTVGGLIRIDTTLLHDAHMLTPFDNDDPDGGQLQANTKGGVVPTGAVGTYPQKTLDNGTLVLKPPVIQSYTNLISDPLAPFTVGSTVFVAGMSQTAPNPGFFNNDGEDASYAPFQEVLAGSTDQHRVVTLRDPITGHTRLIFGDDQGVFTGVDQGNGQLFQSLGDVTDLHSTNGNNPVDNGTNTGEGNIGIVTGSRNGNLQITQFYYGAAQPSILAAEIAGAKALQGGLFYGNAQDDGFPVSDPHLLSDGNISWQGPEGDGTGIATDQTGTGTAYSYQWPCCSTQSGHSTRNFFLVNPKGTGYIGRTGTGAASLIQQNGPGLVPDPQWPYEAVSAGGTTRDVVNSNFVVNPIDGNEIVIASAAGRIFRTNTQGVRWFQIGFVTGDNGATAANTVDGTQKPALAYGAPDPLDPLGQTDDFIYAGSAGGKMYVTLDGGAHWTDITGAGATGLDGSSVVSISANPLRGSHEVYVVTTSGVFHLNFTVSYPASGAPVVGPIAWDNITGNAFGITTAFTQANGNPLPNNGLSFNLVHDATQPTIKEEMPLQYLTAIVADWRYIIPDNPANPTGPTHPALYIGGEGGVYRSMDKGKTWTVFPDIADDGSPVQGGYLPDAHITDLDLAVGNIHSTTGQPDQATGPNLLVATTYGRGSFAIRLPNNSPFNKISGPFVDHATIDPANQVVAQIGGANPGISKIFVTFGSVVDPSTFDTSYNANNVNKIRSFLGPNGPIQVTAIKDVTVTIPGTSGLHNVYEIDFPTQTTSGTYTLVLGPNITDFAGNQMDQNHNGINGEDPGDRYTFSFTINSTDNGYFLSGLYHDMFNRAADIGGFLGFLQPLDNARNAILPGWAQFIVTSDEARGDVIFNPNNNLGYYEQFLHRTASSAEVNSWIQQFKGGLTYEQAAAIIVSSQEYFQNRGSSTDKGFVDAFLTDFFGAVDPNLEAQYLGNLNTAETNARQAVANYIDNSDSYYSDLISNTSPENSPKAGYFNYYLGRPASAQEIPNWLNLFHQGFTNEQVISLLVGGQEFYNRAPTITGDGGAPTDQEYVKALFVKLLKRAPGAVSSGDTSFYVGQLSQGVARSTVAAEIMGSPEYFRNNVLAGYYQRYFGRALGTSEGQGFVDALVNGTRDETILSILLSSAEYFQNNSVQKTTPANTLPGMDANFVQALFNDTDRPPASGEQSNLVGFLAQNEQTARTNLLLQVTSSPAYLSSEIAAYYVNLLGRSPGTVTQGDINSWLPLLEAPPAGPGQPNRDEQLETILLGSQEYFAKQSDPVDPTMHSSRGWLTSLYTNSHLLGRNPDAGFFGNLNALLGEYQDLRLSQTSLFSTSDEYRINLISQFYVKYLHRPAGSVTAADINSWLPQLRAGLSDESFIQILVTSGEYFQYANSQTSFGSDLAERWVNAMYQDVLGRSGLATANDQGARNFTNGIRGGVYSFPQVAAILLGSTEFKANLVSFDYNHYLHRAPSGAEIGLWVPLMQNGFTDEQVIAAMLSSTEYFLGAPTAPVHPFP